MTAGVVLFEVFESIFAYRIIDNQFALGGRQGGSGCESEPFGMKLWFWRHRKPVHGSTQRPRPIGFHVDAKLCFVQSCRQCFIPLQTWFATGYDHEPGSVFVEVHEFCNNLIR